jgi:hypothetical protein
MKQPHFLFRMVALVSSVLLVSGFVSYRAGAFDWLKGTGSETADSGEGPNLGENPARSERPKPKLLPDSKVIIMSESPVPFPDEWSVPASQPAPPDSRKQAPTIMGGTKSPGLGGVIDPAYREIVKEYFRRLKEMDSPADDPVSKQPRSAPQPSAPRK